MSKDYFPEDLLWNILSRLPVKSLLRFRGVSKSWRLMIDCPNFIKTHTKRSKIAESPMKVVVGGYSFDVNKLYSENFGFPKSSETKNIEEIEYPIIYENSDFRKDDITFVGSCNGLICLVYSKYDEDIVLWNPSTGKYCQLPICSKQFRAMKLNDNCCHGFGYDEANDDYKVFRLVKYGEEPSAQHFLSECFVYSLKANEWRCLEDFPFKNDIGWLFNGVFANGALHWILDNHSFLALDVETEVSQLLPLPETSIIDPTLCLQVLGGSQQLIFMNWSSPDREMWVMKDYGIKGSWTKLTFDLAINNKILMFTPLTSTNQTIVLFNLEKQSLELVKFPVRVKDPTTCVYFESLVRLDAGGKNDETLGDSRKPNKNEEGKSKEILGAKFVVSMILALIFAYFMERS